MAESSNGIEQRMRGAAGHSLIYAFGAVLQAGLSILLIPFYTRVFSLEAFGTYSLSLTAATLSAGVFYLGGLSSLSRYYFDDDAADARRETASTAISLTVYGASAQFALALLFAGAISRWLLGSDGHANEIRAAFAASAAVFVTQIWLLLLRLERRPVDVVGANIATVVLTFLAVMLLVAKMGLGPTGAFIASAAGQVLIWPYLVYRTRQWWTWRLVKSRAIAQLKFGWPAIVVGLGYYAVDSIDRLILRSFGSMTDVAVYSVAYTVGRMIQLLVIQTFAQVWNPLRMQYHRHGEAAKFSSLAMTYYFIVGLAFTAVVASFSKEIIALAGGKPEYAAASGVVPIVLFGHLTYGLLNIVDTGLLVKNRNVVHVYVFAASLALNIALNIWWIPRIGFYGAAWATLVTYVFLVGLVWISSHRHLPVPVEWARVITLVLSTVALVAATAVLPGFVLWSIVLRAGLLAAVGWFWFGSLLSADERDWCVAGLRKLALR